MPDDEHTELTRMSAQLHETHGAPVANHEAHLAVAEEVARLEQHPTMIENPGMIELWKLRAVGEVVGNARDMEYQVKTHEMPLKKHEGLVVMGDLQPFAYRSLKLNDGRDVEGQVVASVQYGTKDGGRCEVIIDPTGDIGLATIDNDDNVLDAKVLENYSQSIRAGLGTVEVVRDKRTNRWKVEYKPDAENKEDTPTLRVAETVTPRLNSEVWKEDKNKERRKQAFKWVKRAVGAVALYATLVPGGLIDSVADPFADSHQTIKAAIATFKPTSPIEPNSQTEAEWKHAQAAGAAVEQTMDNLDDHDYQAILDRAEEYRNQHKNEFLDAETADEMLEMLESAETKEEALDALKPLEDLYGIDIVSSDPLSLDALKYTAGEVSEALMILPMGYVDQSGIESIHFETIDEVGAFLGGGAASYENPADNSLHIGSDTELGILARNAVSTMPGATNGFNVKAVFYHELAHAEDTTSGVGVVNQDQIGDAGTPFTIGKDIVLGGILSSPEVVTNYARTNIAENKAENESAILSDRPDGLAHPDEVRKFDSDANEVLLQGLIEAEMNDQGFADYIVSQNSRLMRGQTLGL